MRLAKKQILDMVKEMPNKVNVDEVMYRLYLAKKIEAGEQDIRAGRTLSHERVKKEIKKWFK